MSALSGKYRLDQHLGGGGMAEVFLASTLGAEGFSRRVAIKRVLPGFSENPAFSQMFVEEARISSHLVHPNIVSVLDFARDEEQRLFLVMELVEGKDLDALVGTGLLPVPVVIYVIGEVLRGLGYAHDLPVSSANGGGVRGVVHRDVSPHNVLLSWDGTVKVSDFGIAKARSASEATASVFIKGKPAYMSPEQANGQPLDGRSDLFAVGIMLWEMLAGRRLFVGGDTRSTLAAVLFGQIPRPRSVRPDVPKDLEFVVMKLLERDLPARYATAEDALAELLECADSPRAGRELLAATLADRFADQAPRRHSRSRSIPPNHASLSHTAVGPGGSPSRSMGDAVPMPLTPTPPPMPSLGSVMNAPTGTIEPTRVGGASSGRLSKLLILIAVVFGSGMATFAVVALVKRGGDGGGSAATSSAAGGPGASGPVVSGPVADGPAAPVVAIASPDAPPPPPPAPPPDAAVVATVAPDAAPAAAEPAAQPARREPKGFGELFVPVLTASDQRMSLEVYVDGTKRGDSPLTLRLPAGSHKVKLKNAEANINKTQTVTIQPDKKSAIKHPGK